MNGALTAGEHAVRAVPLASPDQTAGAARAALAGKKFDCADTVCVTDAAGRMVGALRLTALLAASDTARIGDIMIADAPRCLPDADQEIVADLARRLNLAAVPVVGADGRLVGVVPPEALIDVLRREHVEDLHRLAGIMHGNQRAESALEESPFLRLKHRLPWLMVGYVGSLAATAVMARFEDVLQAKVAIAFFVPAIVYLADAIGTQTEAIAVRGLSLAHRPLSRLLMGEIATGLLIGGVMGVLALPAIYLAFGDGRLAVAVALTLVIASTIASALGLLFPWILSRFGQDPAYGSGPVATIVQDVLSLLTYFMVAAVLV